MRTAGLLVLWLIGAAAAIAVATAGIDVVGDEIVDPTPAITASTGVGTSAVGGTAGGEAGTTDTSSGNSDADPEGTSAGGTSSTVETTNTDSGVETIPFTVSGGTAVIDFSATEIVMQWASPAPGYVVETEPENGGIRVEFESKDHRSRIDAWWDNGPQHRIRED